MKKQLLLAMAFVAGVFTANAQEWNFSNFTAGDFTETTTVEGLTVHASSAKKVSIDGSNKTFDDYTFTQRLKFGGTGSFDAETGEAIDRVLSFPVSGNATITIIGTHASSSGDPRNLMVTAGSKENEVGSMEVLPGGDLVKKVISYTGEATTIYIFSASSGINLYLLSVKEDGGGDPTGISSAETNKQVIATEYYNVLGMRLNEPAKGLNIIKKIMDDGSSETTKAYME
ncbi:hypothetical protein NE451_11290 [Bacteroides nordii]|jgi:hypothetical protein|uniref:hypothetical protein n=1 Tax=Bacteroides nordii TaxID=291645 RepID=UPI00210A0B13|nr:hypothetical protein [Bacteroides nordii]MCQ4915072.1 hypothetical protein [Bacteroides nordii]